MKKEYKDIVVFLMIDLLESNSWIASMEIAWIIMSENVILFHN